MAARAAAPKGDKEAKAPKAKKGSDLNGLPPEVLRKLFDDIHEMTDTMESDAAAARADIGRAYEKISDKYNITKEALMLPFKRERRDRKDAAKIAKMDTTSRTSLLEVASAVGGSLGAWITAEASKPVDRVPDEG